MSLVADIYGAIYDLAMGFLNPGWTYDETPVDPQKPWTNGTLTAAVPPIPIIKDQQDQSAPTTGVYLAISGSPALERIGTPDIGVQGSNDVRNIDQFYQGTVTIWEVNGDGSKIQELFDYTYTEDGQAELDATAVSILDYGDIIDVAFKAESRWIPQSRATLTVSIKARISETLSTIQTVEWANAENPEFGGSVEYPST